MHVCMHTHIYINMHVCMHTHIHASINTYTYKHNNINNDNNEEL